MAGVLESFNKYPELIDITSGGNIHRRHNYGHFTLDFIDHLANVYHHYFKKSVTIFLPFERPARMPFDSPARLPVTYKIATLENIDLVKDHVVIFGFFELILKTLGTNKRIDTQLKNIKGNVHILSSGALSIKSFESVALNNSIKINNISLIDFIDPDPDVFNENLESFVDLIAGLVAEGKRVYMSLNLSSNKLLLLENKIKKNGSDVSRRDNPSTEIVINSCSTTEKIVLENVYSVYIMVLPEVNNCIDLTCLIKDIPNGSEVYFDSSVIKNTNKYLNSAPDIQTEFTDSKEFKKYSDIPITDPIMASEEYHLFEAPDHVRKYNLSNLSKAESDTIRKYIKTKLGVKTCQLATPCSPKNRSRNLNSLSNKISSFNYRCECTCEIFKDYTIGAVVWTDLFSGKDLSREVLKDNTYVYRTTNGNWKYTVN